MKESKKVLGIDLGTNSIGWAIMSYPDNEKKDESVRLDDAGVVLFDEGVIIEKGNEKSKAAERTKYRSARRLHFRRKLRKYETLKVLAKNGMVPLSLDEVEDWRQSNFSKYPQNKKFFDWLRTDDKINKNPYYLRARAVNEKLGPLELGRVFYHLAQRRGFLSNRLEQKEDDRETGVVKNEIAEITRKIQESGAKSLGEFFWMLYQRDRNNPDNKIRKHYLGRKEHYLQEFELICQKQELPGELCDALRKAIFYQRPLKSQKSLVGKCVFEPHKHRVPVSHPLFEQFRMWSFINTIKIKTPQDEELRFLTPEEKEKIVPLFESAPRQKTFLFERIAKKLIPGEYKKAKFAYYKSKEAQTAHFVFNYDKKHSVHTSPVIALLKKYIGDDWEQKIFKYTVKKKNGETVEKSADYNDIWHVLFTFEDADKIKEFVLEKLKLDEETADAFAKFNLPQGYASLSLKAIRRILPFLKAGYLYDKAVILAKIPEIVGLDIWEAEENQKKILEKIDDIFNRNTFENKLIRSVNRTLHERHQKRIFKPIAVESLLKDNLYDIFGKKVMLEHSAGRDIFEEAKTLLEERLKYSELEDQIIKQQTIEEKVKEFLKQEYQVPDKELKKLYHPSMMNIYPDAPVSEDGKRYLQSPIVSSIKNPVMMRSMHMLRKLINKLISDGRIDEDTVIHIELARDLNTANMRAAIKQYQRQREKENETYRKEILELFKENNINREPSKDDIRRYRLWKEQNEISIYTGKTIPAHKLFDGTQYDFEHTIPRSVSFDNSLANLTLTESWYNREVKKDKIPTELDDYDEIKKRLEPWEQKLRELEKSIQKVNSAKKQAVTKEARDRLIQKAHVLKMERDYWAKKLRNFTIEEVTDSFKVSQLNDTRIITKYARAYLKSVFKIVHVVNGRMVAEFRKMWGLQKSDEKKSRAYHTHHAIDAVVIASMTRPLYNLLAEAWKYEEEDKKEEAKKKIEKSKPWREFTEDVLRFVDKIPVYHDFRDLLPKHSKKKLRKRGIIRYRYVVSPAGWIKTLIEKGIYREGEDYFIVEKDGKKFYKLPVFAEGDTARGVLHRETFYGAIARKDKNGKIVRNSNGDVEVDYVVRKPIDGLKKEDIEKIVDPVVRKIVRKDFETKKNLEEKIKKLKKELRNTTEEKEISLKSELAALEKEKETLFRLPTKKGGFVPIKKVRIKTRVTNPLPDFKQHRDLSAKPWKRNYYVVNEQNYALAFYEGVDANGNLKREYEIIPNIEAAKYFRRSQSEYRKQHSLFPETKKGLPLKYILKKGMSVLFYKDSPAELKELPKEELVKRLYVITQLGNQTYFIPHNLAGKMTDIKKDRIYAPNLEENKLMVLTKSNWNFIVDGFDFKIQIDGKIKFLK